LVDNLKMRYQRRRRRRRRKRRRKRRRRKRRRRRETRKRKSWRRRETRKKQEEVVGGERDPEAAEMEKKKTLTVTLNHTVEHFFRLELEILPFGFCAP